MLDAYRQLMQLYNHTNMKVSIVTDDSIYNTDYESETIQIGLTYIECVLGGLLGSLWQSQYGYLVGLEVSDLSLKRMEEAVHAILTDGGGLITYIPLFRITYAGDLSLLRGDRQFRAARNSLASALKRKKGSSL